MVGRVNGGVSPRFEEIVVGNRGGKSFASVPSKMQIFLSSLDFFRFRPGWFVLFFFCFLLGRIFGYDGIEYLVGHRTHVVVSL